MNSDLEMDDPLPEQNSDVEVEQDLPAAVLANDTAAPAQPLAELDDFADSDIDVDESSAEAPNPAEDSSHWMSENTQLDQPMEKAPPAGFKPLSVLVFPSLDESALSDVVAALEPVASRMGEGFGVWIDALRTSRAFMPEGSQFKRTMEDSVRRWRQHIEHDGIRMGTSVPANNKPQPGAVLSGADALVQMSRVLGTYERIQFPLWHSGVWLSVAVPAGDELHTLETRMARAKYDLGWHSKGLTYSNTMVMQNVELINFILERVVATNLEDSSIDALKDAIRITDLNTLAGNLAMAIYPAGFPMERACSADPMKCHSVVQGIVRLSKLLWTDDAALSDWQKKHMQTRMVGRKKTVADLREYQEKFNNVGRRVVEIKPGLSVSLLPPTLKQYEESGYTWIDSIERSANQMLTTMSEAELNRYMTTQYQMTSMRQYAHWVDAILFEDNITVTGREEINASLQKASTESEVVERFIAAVKEFIDDCTMSVVAINNYSCPACGKSQAPEASRHPKLIPLDAVSIFFTLSGLKTRSTLLKNMAH